MAVPGTAAVEMVEAAMTKDEAHKLERGLYRVFWKAEVGGGQSLAAVGSTYSGSRWLAATNWVGITTDETKLEDTWDKVEKVELIEAIQ